MLIAAAQIPVDDNIDKNLSTILSSIEQAAKNSAQLICFPEVCLISNEEDARSITKEINQIKKSAIAHNISVIFGSYAIWENKLRNKIIVIRRDGKILSRYKKKNLYLSESPNVKPGRINKVLEIDNMKFAVINCWDYAFPEEIRRLAKKGAQVIFCPAYLMSHKWTKEVLVKIPQVRAFDSMAYFVMVDACNDETFRNTRICHPLYEMAKIIDKPGIIYADINLEEIPAWRSKLVNLK